MSIFDIINAKKYWISIKSELNAAQSFTSIAKIFKTKSYAFLASGSFSRKNSFRIGSWNVVCNILFPFLSFGFWISPIRPSYFGQNGVFIQASLEPCVWLYAFCIISIYVIMFDVSVFTVEIKII